MTDKRIVWRHSDDSISVTTPCGRLAEEAEDAWLDRVAARVQSTSLDMVAATRLPNCLDTELPGRYFRDCWRNDEAGKAHVDMPLARIQRMDEIRVDRDSRFPALDNEWMKAMGQKDQTIADEVEAKRQILRDIPADVDLSVIDTPETLEGFTPLWP